MFCRCVARQALLVRRSPAILTRHFVSDAGQVSVDNFPRRKLNTILNVCGQGKEMVIETFGKYTETRPPGLFFAIPLVHRLKEVDKRELTLPVNPQWGTTQDNVGVHIAGVVYFQFDDSVKACYGARRPVYALLQASQAAMRAGVGKIDLDDLFHNRETLNKYVKGALDEASPQWGVNVKRYEITSVTPDDTIARAMDLQAAAERERRQTVKNAEADKESTVLRSEAQRTRDTNESEGIKIRLTNEALGEKQKIVLEAEAHKERVILEAEAQKQSIIAQAEAQAEGIVKVAESLCEQNAGDAMKYRISREYIDYLATLAKYSRSNTIFLPENMGDVSNLVAKGMGILNAMDIDKGTAKEP